MSKAGIKGRRMLEHQPEAHWGVTVVQPHEKGELGSDLPFKVKCVMNKCIVGFFFFLQVVIPDHFPFQLQILTLRRGSRPGARRRDGEEGRNAGSCLKPVFLTNLLYYETKFCSSSLPAALVWCLRFCACE